ncbi:MAG: hypothetical protein U1E50_19495 [Caulobacteraceae bacterium]
MSAMQLIPLSAIQPGDRVCIAGREHALHRLPEVLRVEGPVVVVKDGTGEDRIALAEIESAVRFVPPLFGA